MYLAQGEYDKAVKALTTNFKPSGITYYWLGAAYAAKGDRSEALDTIQKAFQNGFADFAAIDNSPYFVSLKSDPRFQQLILEYKKKTVPGLGPGKMPPQGKNRFRAVDGPNGS